MTRADMDPRAILPPTRPEYEGWEEAGTTHALDHLVAAAVLLIMGVVAFFTV